MVSALVSGSSGPDSSSSLTRDICVLRQDTLLYISFLVHLDINCI